MNGQAEALCQRHDDTTAGRTVKLRNDQPRDLCDVAKHLHLPVGVLSGRRIKHQHHVVRRRLVKLAQYADNFGQLVHQIGLVVQAPGGIDSEHIAALCLGTRQGVVSETSRIATGLSGNHRHAGTLTPDTELLYRRGAEGIARRQHNLVARCLPPSGQLTDSCGLTGTVNADRQHHMWSFGRVEL